LVDKLFKGAFNLFFETLPFFTEHSDPKEYYFLFLPDTFLFLLQNLWALGTDLHP
jgi:hypothetical protein